MLAQVEPIPGQFFRVSETEGKKSKRKFIKVETIALGRDNEEIVINTRMVDKAPRHFYEHNGKGYYAGVTVDEDEVTPEQINETFYILKKLQLDNEQWSLTKSNRGDILGDYPAKTLNLGVTPNV